MTLFFILLSIITGLIYGFLTSNINFIDEKYFFYISRIFYLCISFVLVRLISYIIVEKSLGAAKDKIPSGLLRFIVSAILYILAAALIMKFGFNMNLAALLTTSALLTAVIGFAMQSTLGNIFSGLSLQLEQLFYIGDTVRIKNIIGSIEALTWRSVSIRTPESSIIVIPNGKISSDDVEVFPENNPVLVKVKVPAPISNPPQKVRKIINDVIMNVPNIAKHKPIIVNMDSIEPDDKLNMYSIAFFCERFVLKFSVAAMIKERIWYAFLRNGIDILNIEKDTSISVMPYFFEKEEVKSDITPAHYLNIIHNTAILEPLNKEEKIYIADNMEKLFFTHGEPIFFEDSLEHAMFIIASGKVKAEYKASFANECLLFTEKNEIEEVSEVLWDPEILHSISKEFISFVGPIGGHLVKQAARSTLDPYRLYHILAADIENENDKEKFLNSVPECPVKNLYVKDFFGEMKLFAGITNMMMNYEAIGHVDIIVIKPFLMKDILERRPVLSQDFSKIIVKYFKDQPEFKALFEDKDAEKGILEKINSFYNIKED
jgi:small-conductance mechanosensitive channel